MRKTTTLTSERQTNVAGVTQDRLTDDPRVGGSKKGQLETSRGVGENQIVCRGYGGICDRNLKLDGPFVLVAFKRGIPKIFAQKVSRHPHP